LIYIRFFIKKNLTQTNEKGFFYKNIENILIVISCKIAN